MQEWDSTSDKVMKIRPDREMAKALLRLVEMREKDVAAKDPQFSTLIVEGYYEMVKELITAIMAIDGYKTLSHELLVGYLAAHYDEFSMGEITRIDQLRKTRNDIAYRGVMVPPEYLKRNREAIIAIVGKLKQAVVRKLA